MMCDMKKPICMNCLKRFEPVRRDAVTCSPACRQARARRLRAQTPPLPEGETFDLLLLDLPLDWHGWSRKGEGRSPQRHYDTMDVPALCRLGEKVASLMAKNAAAASWVYGPRLFPALPTVMEACGFEYRAQGFDGFDWIKLDKSGRPMMGNGKTTRKGAETVLLWRRGKGLSIVDHNVRQVIFAPRGKRHSEKPQQVHEGLERLYGDVRRLELFGRRTRAGWRVWGNQLED